MWGLSGKMVRMLKAALFDLDYTLLDRNRLLIGFLHAQHQRFEPLFQGVDVKAYSQRFLDLDAYGMVWKDKVYQAIISEFKIRDITWETLLEDYRRYGHRFAVLYDGVLPLLTSLKAAGITLGLITNGCYDVQFSNIEAAGLTPFFSSILISETEGLKKPDVRIFHRALFQLGAEPRHAVMVGDHPISDIKGAKNAGIKTIWKRNTLWGPCNHADAEFEGFEALAALL